MNNFARPAAFAAAFAVGTALAATPIHPKIADQVLKPGDVLFKVVGEESPATSYGIAASQTVISQFYTAWNSAAGAGNPGAIHNVVYVGNGQFAEAWAKNNQVGVRDIDAHKGYFFHVYRAKDAGLAAEAAAIARTWATGRMKYKDPSHVPFRSSSWGPVARGDAVRYGDAATRTGGPKDDSAMFCSEFAVAVYQGAAVARHRRAGNSVNTLNVKAPPGMALDASNTSPLVLNGSLEHAAKKGEWQKVGVVLVQSPPAAGYVVPVQGTGIEWPAYAASKFPEGAVIAGEDSGVKLAVCRAKHEGGVHPGKTIGANCNIGWGGKEVSIGQSEILVATGAPPVRWVQPGSPGTPVVGGREPNRTLAVCRGEFLKVVHPGKVVDGTCNIGWRGKEIRIPHYEVLVR